MRLKNYLILLVLILTVCFLQAGVGYSARLSEGNEIASPQPKTKKAEFHRES